MLLHTEQKKRPRAQAMRESVFTICVGNPPHTLYIILTPKANFLFFSFLLDDASALDEVGGNS